jgi:hypothetical protein
LHPHLHPTYLLIDQIVRIGRVQGCNLQESLTGVNGELRAVMTEVQARTRVISLCDWDLAHLLRLWSTGNSPCSVVCMSWVVFSDRAGV